MNDINVNNAICACVGYYFEGHFNGNNFTMSNVGQNGLFYLKNADFRNIKLVSNRNKSSFLGFINRL